MTERGTPVSSAEFTHAALLYRGPEEYVSTVSDFVRSALENDDPVFVAVPGARLNALRQPGPPPDVELADSSYRRRLMWGLGEGMRGSLR